MNPEANVSKKIAFCGLDCNQCGAFIAYRDNDDQKRVETAAEWSKMFGADIKSGDVNCSGCKSDEMLFQHCKVCGIRQCGMERNIENCAFCDDFPCSKVEGILNAAPEARENLEQLRMNP